MRRFLFAFAILTAAVVRAEAPPETILSIDRPKAGKESELRAALDEAHLVYERLGAVSGPIAFYRANDETGGIYFVEILTWRSADIPDNAPSEIRLVWTRLQSLVEKRNGRPGIEFYAIEPLSGGSSPRAAAPSK